MPSSAWTIGSVSVKLLIKVRGMHCQHCVDAVRASIGELPGIDVFDVAVGVIELTFDETRISKADIFAAIRKAGSFDVNSFSIA